MENSGSEFLEGSELCGSNTQVAEAQVIVEWLERKWKDMYG